MFGDELILDYGGHAVQDIMRGLAYCQPAPGLELKLATTDLLPIVRLPTTYLPLLQVISYNVAVMGLCVCIFS